MSEMFTWRQLNDKLRKTKSEAEVLKMFNAEKENGNRPRWRQRIWARLARLRRRREQRELAQL